MNRDSIQASGQFEETQTASTIEEYSFDREKAGRTVRLLGEAISMDPNQERLRETWQRRVPATFETLSEGPPVEAKQFTRDTANGLLTTCMPRPPPQK